MKQREAFYWRGRVYLIGFHKCLRIPLYDYICNIGKTKVMRAFKTDKKVILAISRNVIMPFLYIKIFL